MKSTLLTALLAMTTLHAAAQAPARPALPATPEAPREAKDVTVHGDKRSDDYFWIRDRKDPRTLPYIEAESAYAQAWFARHAALQDKLYAEMLARVKQDDEAVPYRRGAWWYSSRTAQGQQYPVLTRRAAAGAERRYDPAAAEQVLLDLNDLARGKPFLALGEQALSPNGHRLAYTLDETGGRDFTLHVKDLRSGKTLPFSLPEVQDAAWGNDERTLYYTTVDATKRAFKLWRQAVGARGALGSAELLYEEKDEQFDIGLQKTLDGRYLVLTADSKDSSEQRLLDASRRSGAFRVLYPRRDQVKYDVAHRAGQLFVRINDTGRNFRVVRVDARKPQLASGVELIAARPDVMLANVLAFKHHLVVSERRGGLTQLRMVDLEAGGDQVRGEVAHLEDRCQPAAAAG